ncbi:MAG: hypothetical protein CVU06_06740 [Bacteroidetes bacterium HGW-Bacteroidetes-22]|nr:MAG: hypothetical protein CVU06_06740 [Bacteroidetes bacterium HGW-Bacteroidetes-22]
MIKDFENRTIYDPVNDPVSVDDPENDPENERQKHLLFLIGQNRRISITELTKECKVGRETIKRDLNKLKSLNLLQRIGPAKGGHWEVVSS